MDFGIQFQQIGIILLSISYKNHSFLIRYHRDINTRQSSLSGFNNIRFGDFIDCKNTFSVSEIFIFAVNETLLYMYISQ